MKRSVQIYVENVRLELFDDEKIVVNSSVQNISDLAKVFTDFSQSFTIPATKINNEVFEHYYNNDVDNTIDHNKRRLARIEIDYTPFRSGKIQIEKGEVVNGEPQYYTVTFFGEVVTLKDLIGEDKLSDLIYSDYDHDYSGAEVQARIETDELTTPYDVRYPLISSGRVWQHGDSTANDISIVGGAIDYTELFPALRVVHILQIIADTYGFSFTGSMLSEKWFMYLFLWFKNKESYTYYSQPKTLRFAIGDPSTNFLYESQVQLMSVPQSSLLTGIYDAALNITHSFSVDISTGSAIDYFLDVYKDGYYENSLPGNGAQSFNIVTNMPNYGFNNAIYTFKLRSSSSMTFACTVNYELKYNLYDTATSAIVPTTDSYSETSATSFTTTTYTDLQQLAPDMKIVDFLSGLFNVYNLTCYSTVVDNAGTKQFRIEPLENFYASGNDIDITEYVINDNITYDRPKLYNNISFEWGQCNSFMNREFYDLFKREYGSLNAYFGYDGGDYTIKLPFESPLHTQFTGTDICVAYCLGTEPEYKNYIPKPTLISMYDYTNVGAGTQIKFNNGSSVVDITDYMPFGQDTVYNGDDVTLNFGADISAITETLEDKSLFRRYYQNYLANLYNPKTRIVTVKTILPLTLLTEIRLNDSLLIRDKKYIINDMKTDLTTGEVEFVLLSNWRLGHGLTQNITINSDSQDIDIAVNVPPRNVVTFEAVVGDNFTTVSNPSPADQEIVVISATANPTTSTRVDVYPVSYEIGSFKVNDYISITQLGIVS